MSISEKNFSLLRTVLLLTLAGCMVTIAWISFCFVPNGDDFFFIVQAQKHSPWANSLAMFQRWGLRTGSVLAFLISEVNVRWFFALLNCGFFAALGIVAWRLAATAPPRCGTRKRLPELAVTFLLLMYGAARARDVYFWMSGAVTYMWTMTLTLAFFAYFIYGYLKKQPWKTWQYFTLPGVFAAGAVCGMSNENNCPGGMLVFLFLLWKYFREHRKIPPALWTGMAGFLTGAALLIFAPGTRLRYAAEVSAEISIFDRAAFLPELTVFWGFASLPAMILTACCITAVICRQWQGALNRKTWEIFYFDTRLRTALLLMGCSLLMAWAFAAAHPPALRAYFSCFVLNVIAAVMVFAYTRDHVKIVPQVIFAGLWLFAAVLAAPAFRDAVQIRNDEIFRCEEAAKLRDIGVKDAVLPAHTIQRRRLLHYVFVEDISNDPKFFVNVKAAEYYGFATVRSREKQQTATYWKNNHE